MTEPVALSVAAGLVLGKPLGIVAFSWVAVKLGLAQLPTGVNWKILLSASCLAGIGFTKSLFIAGLALEAELLSAGKIGTLVGSLISALLGVGLLKYFLSQSESPQTVGETSRKQKIPPRLASGNKQPKFKQAYNPFRMAG